MSLHQLKVLKQLLKDLETTPRRSLSQNFLIDANIVHKIVSSAEAQPNETLLEVGPGPGVLTEALLQTGATLIAIEKDDRFAAALKKWTHPNLTILHQDILETDFSLLAENPIKMVANLPYNITGILLQKLLPLNSLFSTLTLMVQKEVAERMTAKTGSSLYSSFTLFTEYYSTPKLLFTVPPTCFYPKPKVTSAVIQLTLKPVDPSAPSPLKLIRRAFQQRRKMLRASLKTLYPVSEILFALKEMGLPETTRPQELSLKQFTQFEALLPKRKIP